MQRSRCANYIDGRNPLRIIQCAEQGQGGFMDSLNEKGVTGDDGNAQETEKPNNRRVNDEAAAVKLCVEEVQR